MSRAIFAVDNTAARPRKWRGFLADGRTLLVLLALMGSQTASADPAQANLALQFADIHYQTLKLQFQTGRQLALSGQASAARTYFQSAHFQAVMLNVDLQQLLLENMDSQINGQCNDCNLQQQAVTYSQLASVDSTVLQYQLSQLAQTPNSQALISQVHIQTILLDLDLQQAEYYTHAAQ
jgi:hypothetical protein